MGGLVVGGVKKGQVAECYEVGQCDVLGRREP